MSTLLNNRYRILQTLGSGGCGETFLAEDTHMPSRRRCVIKQLKPATNAPNIYQIIQERFEREAATLEMLGMSSDQIPALHAYFVEDKEFYLVQDLVVGKSLLQMVKEEGAFSEKTVKDILVNLLPVLDYIHSQGIIHRDLKPENIMFRERDGKPVLIDFGAVKEVVATVVDLEGSPTSSIVIGSPGFMPLEQAAGKPIFASDLYSLGLTAIYLLTGKRPKELTDLLTGEISWHGYVVKVSPDLASILDKAIRPYANERYRTAKEMLEAIQALDNRFVIPIPAPPKPPIPPIVIAPRLGKALNLFSKLRDKSSPVWISILLWGIIGCGSGLLSYSALDIPTVGVFASGPIFGVAIFLFGEFSSSPSIGKRRRIFSFAVIVIASAIGWYVAFTNGLYLLQTFDHHAFLIIGIIWGAFIISGELLCWRFNFQRWIYAVCLLIITSLLLEFMFYGERESRTFPLGMLMFMLWPALVLVTHAIAFRMNKWWLISGAGLLIWLSVILLIDNNIPKNDNSFQSYSNLPYNSSPGANTNYNTSIEVNTNYSNPPSNAIEISRAVTHANLGESLYTQEKYAEATAEYKKAIKLDPQNDQYHNMLGNSLFRQGKYSAAEAAYRVAFRLVPGWAGYNFSLGESLYAQKNYSEAAILYTEAIRLAPDNDTYHNNLGNSLYMQGKYTAAITKYQTAIRNQTFSKYRCLPSEFG